MRKFTAYLILLVFPVLTLSGCNAFAGFHGAGNSNDPDILLEDAQIALQQGDADKAIEYLRRAIEVDPDNVPAKTTLATALFEKHDISVLDVVGIAERVRSDVQSNFGASARVVPAARFGGSEVCSFTPDGNERVFDPADFSSFANIVASKGALDEVDDLLSSLIDPDQLASSIDELRGEGLSDDDIAASLLNGALAKFILAYVAIVEAGGDSLTFYYADGNVGYCAPDQATLDAILAAIACHVTTLKDGIDLLFGRIEMVGSEETSDVADEATEAYDRLVEALGASCSADASSVALASAAPPVPSLR